MKKLKLILAGILLCTATAFADVQINEENFPDENFRNLLLQNYYAKNGMFTDADIAKMWTFPIRNQNISDLTGIQFFTNLQALHCEGNQLTSLDVSGLTNLQRLHCENNQLNSLDVSGLNNLKWLRCENNQLTSLDVSELNNLQTLYCNDNLLTLLNVSGLTNLQTLGCADNRLNSLDASGLTNLQELYCENNQLTLLNVSGLNNLQTLHCYNNQLNSLNVSGLANLRTLLCFNNQLISLDLTGLPNVLFLMGSEQTATLTLTGANDNYNLAIDLNNPTDLAFGLSYENGILTSTSNAITESSFTVETGHYNLLNVLSGTLNLIYDTTTSATKIKNENRQPIAFYTMMGVKLNTEPQNRMYIILYDDGTSEKVIMRK